MMMEIAKLSATYAETINPVASLGFIGLATDRASYRDFSDFIRPFEGVDVHSTKIPFVEKATPETLSRMENHLQDGTRVLVPGQPLGSISFSCTSGTIAIGSSKVASLIHSVRPQCAVVTPIDAAISALNKLECKNISLLMPYLMSTAMMVTKHFEENGFLIDRAATFDLGGDPEMNIVEMDCIYQAALSNCDPGSDALFISCTGWRTYPVIDRIEKALGKPVVTSNQALAWAALQNAGVHQQVEGMGEVFAKL